MNVKNLYIAVVISFIYVFIGTVDNFNGLPFEHWLTTNLCNGGLCELLIIYLYAWSYLGVLLSLFLGGSDTAIIICQFFVFMGYSVFFYGR